METGREGAILGLAEAMRLFGQPVERECVHRVSGQFLAERQQVSDRRPGEVVLALRRKSGRYLVHTKAFYPPGTYRLLSGGIRFGETLLSAVRREVWEETSLETHIDCFLAVLHHTFAWRTDLASFDSYLFLLSEETGSLASQDPGEAITGYREVTLREILALANQLESLSGRWHEWGCFRAVAHRVLVEIVDDRGC